MELPYLKVSEMKAEYFPPKEDVILQNEAPTDFYILVTGAVVSLEFLCFISTGLNIVILIKWCLMVNYLIRN